MVHVGRASFEGLDQVEKLVLQLPKVKVVLARHVLNTLDSLT